MMKQFVTLCMYELKKLLQKKLVWISLILCVLASAFTTCVPLLGTYYIDGKRIDTNYHMYQIDKDYATALNGRKIDQSLLDETMDAYQIPATWEQHCTLTEEYRPYSAIFNFISGTMNMRPSEMISSWQPDENELYEGRQKVLNNLWKDAGLSSGEMEFWQERENQIEKPFIYQEHGGYEELFLTFQTVGFLVLMFIAIALSGIFFDEHTKRTDQLILCSPLGKTTLYWAKMATGIVFSVGITILLFLFTCSLTLCLYGTNGFHAAFQLIYRGNSDPVSCGQAILIAYGNMLAAAIIASVFVMIISELLHSNIAALAVSAALLMVSLIVTVPAQYRVLAQIWNWLPCSFLAPWNVFGEYTLTVFGCHFTPWQAVPVIYLVTSVIIVFVGKPLYERFQVSGR